MELYVHIPFCRQKCRYCSFASFPGQEAYYDSYIRRIEEEAVLRAGEADEDLRTVYLGGGTPSLLSPEQLGKLIEGLENVFSFAEVTEFTSEANPGTLTAAWLDQAARSGVNRLSLGMQAYQTELLETLGRIHSFREVRESAELARKAGINNLNLDLIFGIPGQTIKDWKETLEAAVSLQPSHISAYGLIPEEDTPLYRDLKDGLLTLPEPEIEREMYDLAIEFLRQRGFDQYEVSNFARAGKECVHNIGYWTQVPYLGLGVAAASMTGLRQSDAGMTYLRRTNPDTISLYDAAVRRRMLSLQEQIFPGEARFETMMLGLRMNRGVSLKRFEELHHCSLEEAYGKKLRELERKGLVHHQDGYWKLTRRGFDVQNAVLVEMMDE